MSQHNDMPERTEITVNNEETFTSFAFSVLLDSSLLKQSISCSQFEGRAVGGMKLYSALDHNDTIPKATPLISLQFFHILIITLF